MISNGLKIIAVGSLLLFGIDRMIETKIFLYIFIVVLLVYLISLFAKMNAPSQAIDADEIVPPQKAKRLSSSDEVVDMEMDMESERQLWRLEARQKKLKDELSQTNKRIKTIKDR